MAVKTAKIEKIYFMIHPTCWADGGSPQEGYLEETGYNASDWYVSLNWEKEVNQKQKEFISNMGPGEAMVIIPINHDAPSAQMRDLWDHAERCLGRRIRRARGAGVLVRQLQRSGNGVLPGSNTDFNPTAVRRLAVASERADGVPRSCERRQRAVGPVRAWLFERTRPCIIAVDSHVEDGLVPLTGKFKGVH